MRVALIGNAGSGKSTLAGVDESKEIQDRHLDFLLTGVREYCSREGELSLAAHQALFASYRGPKHKLTARIGLDQLDALAR